MRFVNRVLQHALGLKEGANHPPGLPFLAARAAACPPGVSVWEDGTRRTEEQGALWQAREQGRATGQWHDYSPGAVPPTGAIVFFPATEENGRQGRLALSLGGGKVRCSRSESDEAPQVADWELEELARQEGAEPAGWFIPGRRRKEPGQEAGRAGGRSPTPGALPAQGSRPRHTAGVAALAGLRAPQGQLQRGMTGDAVEQLQRALVALGYLTAAQMKAGLGVFGPQTQAALMRFQMNHGIAGTGIYGPNTRAALGRALGDK